MSIVVSTLGEVETRPRRVAIGVFDGVHAGHRRVIAGADTVLTFEPHPLSVLHPDAAPKLITAFEVKRDIIAGLGVEELVVVPFNRDFSLIPAEAFIAEILVSGLEAEQVAVGENFRFGAGAKGGPVMLAAHREFETRIEPLIEVGGETVSSSRIRALVAAGDVAMAARCLEAPFLIVGEVRHGDKRGRELGVPTANLVPDDHLVCPGHGVYAGFVDGHPAAINVGVRPTFATGRGLLVEAHLIDFDGDLYGSDIRVAFVARLRGEHRFDSVDDLVAQMRLDIAAAANLCASFSSP